MGKQEIHFCFRRYILKCINFQNNEYSIDFELKKVYYQTTFLAIIACLLWSTAFVGIKIGLVYTTPIQFAGIRFTLSGLMILPFTGGLTKFISEIKKNPGIVVLISLLQTVLQYSLFYFGLSMVPAALAAIIIGSQPLFIALIAHFFVPDDKLTWRRLMIFLFGFLGIVFVSIGRDKFISSGEAKILGVILLIGVNIVSAFANILISRDGDKIQPLALSSSAMFFGGIILILISLIIEGASFGIKPFPYYASLGWLSFLSASALSIWFILLKRPKVKVSDLNFWKSIIPVFGVLLSWIILSDEKPGFIPFTGMAIITISLILLNIYKSRHP